MTNQGRRPEQDRFSDIVAQVCFGAVILVVICAGIYLAVGVP